MKQKKFINIKKCILPVAVTLCIVLCLTLLLVSGLSGNGGFQPPLKRLSFSGTYSTDGETFIAIEDSVPDGGEQIILSGSFDRKLSEDEVVWLRLENIGVKVIINGEEVLSCYQAGEFPDMFNAPGYTWKNFSYPQGIDDATVDIYITCYYGNSARTVGALLEGFCTGDGGGFFFSSNSKSRDYRFNISNCAIRWFYLST